VKEDLLESLKIKRAYCGLGAPTLQGSLVTLT
jgi:hypothetical protein